MKIPIPVGILFFLFFTVFGLNAQSIEPRDCAEIRMQAAQTLLRFERLLNNLADPSYYPSERNSFIQNSFRLDYPGRIFYDSLVIVENDLNPVGNVEKNIGLNDRKVKHYLQLFDLFYSKYETESIFFSDLHFGPVRENEFVFLHIFFTSEFRGCLKDTPDRPLLPHDRVATIRAEKIQGQWRTYLLQVNFFRPDFQFVLDHQDADCDGITDSEDKCPEEAGTLLWGGCPPPPEPDLDQDGIVDSKDDCPEQRGPWCAQGCPLPATENIGNTQVQWQELLGNTGLDVAFDISKNEKGEIVFAGETEIDGKGKDLYMAIFDPCRKYIGNRLVLGGAQNDGARKITQVSSGLYALAGYSESSGSGSRDAWLLLTDGTQKLGEKFFGTARSLESFADLVKDSLGNLLFTGEKDGKIWLLKTTLEGNVLKEIVYSGNGASTGTALALAPNGEVFLTGFETSGNRKKLLVLHFNESAGRLEKIYERPNAQGMDIIVDREGQLVVAGTVYTKRTRDDIFAIRLDTRGKPLWDEAKTFGGIGVDVGSSIFETWEGYYVLAGYSSSYADGARREQLWVDLMNSSGDSLWDAPLFLGDRFSERAYGITQIEANSIITAGLSSSSIDSKKARKSDFWLVSIILK